MCRWMSVNGTPTPRRTPTHSHPPHPLPPHMHTPHTHHTHTTTHPATQTHSHNLPHNHPITHLPGNPHHPTREQYFSVLKRGSGNVCKMQNMPPHSMRDRMRWAPLRYEALTPFEIPVVHQHINTRLQLSNMIPQIHTTSC